MLSTVERVLVSPLNLEKFFNHMVINYPGISVISAFGGAFYGASYLADVVFKSGKRPQGSFGFGE
jgi:hypothetical protein